MHRPPIATIVTGAVIVLLLVGYLFTFSVRFNERAVRSHLGKVDASSVIDKPGWYFRWPAPIDSIRLYDTRLRTLDATEAEIKTIDGKNVIMRTYALWRIRDPLQYHVSVKTERDLDNDLRSRLNQARAAVVGQHSMSDLVNLDEQQLAYDQIRQAIRDQVAPGVASTYGIEIVQVGVGRITLPQRVTQQVFMSMNAEREQIATSYRASGRSTAEGIKSRAKSDADAILAFADTRAQEIRSRGIQASTSILEKISAEDRPFFEFLRWMDAIKAMFRQRTTIFLDEKSPFFDPFMRPALPAGEPAPPASQPAARP